MADLPAGEWTDILVGDQWPNLFSLEVISDSAKSRRNLAAVYEHYSDHLHQVKRVDLALQDGYTAEEVRGAFAHGAAYSSHIARINLVKRDAYITAYDKVAELRYWLNSLAEEGNARIGAISKSKKPISDKTAEILQIIAEIRERSFLHAAGCIGQISDQIRLLLNTQGLEKPPQSFAAERGAAPATRNPTDSEQLRAKISKMLDQASVDASPTGSPPTSPTTSYDSGQNRADSSPSSLELADGGAANDAKPTSAEPAGPPPITSTAIAQGAEATASPSGLMGTISPPPITTIGESALTHGAKPTITATTGGPHISTIAIADGASSQISSASNAAMLQPTIDAANHPSLAPTAVSGAAAPPMIDTLADAATPSTGSNTALAGPAPLDPNELSGSFAAQTHSSATIAAAGEAIATAVVTPVHATPTLLSTPVETIAPAPPVFETAHAVSSQGHDLAHVGPASADVAPPVIAPTPPAVGAPAIPPLISAGPAAIPGPTPPSGLIAYGADLRPPAAAAAAAPPVNVAAAGSAPINSSGSAAPAGQPTVVRQPHSAATPLAVAAGLTERAVAAATGGAAVGATAARTEAENRLRRLLFAVVRQQPQLRWAIRLFDNGDTALATDFAGGWLPPHIDVPVGVKLLQPTAHRRNLAALLGAATLTAHYEPGQCLPPAAEPVAMSIRARDTTAVEDLGWALSQATKWRDGLPRLAHTLAKAITAQTGFIDSEVVLLHEHLSAVERIVLVQYPANVNPAEVGNWQLLATIAALLDNDKRRANYHFAWFQTQALTRGGHQ